MRSLAAYLHLVVMDFELKLEKPKTMMAGVEGFVMGVSYFIGTYTVLCVLSLLDISETD